MTRKDYQKISAVIDNNRHEIERHTDPDDLLDSISSELAGVLADDNPRFDRGRFLEACGVRQQ